MENETVLLLLSSKSLTKTSQLNDIATMIYHGGCPVLKIPILCKLPFSLMGMYIGFKGVLKSVAVQV